MEDHSSGLGDHGRYPAQFRQMKHDELTGIGTKALFDMSLCECLQSPSASSSLSLLCVNIDNMKRFNMHNGPEKGDELIKLISKLVEKTIPSTAKLFRTGGDQFMVILEPCDQTEAVNVSNEIVSSVAREPLVHQEEHCGDQHCMGPADISVSIGVASTTSATGVDAKDLSKIATEKMLEAKLAGRDCTKW